MIFLIFLYFGSDTGAIVFLRNQIKQNELQSYKNFNLTQWNFQVFNIYEKIISPKHVKERERDSERDRDRERVDK